jgi:diacylglycerol kinase family enzyme
MRVSVVLNTSAGSLLGVDEAEAAIAAAFEARAFDATFEPDDGRSLNERMDAAVERGSDAVVVGGGDGTIACAVQRLAGTGVALAVLPLGTANLFARDLGMPLEDIGAAVDAIAGGTVRDIDVGEVNGHVFVCNSVLGLASRLAKRRERFRGSFRLRDWWAFLVSAWRGLVRYPAMRLELEANGRKKMLRTRALTVVDGDYEEGFGRMFSRSALDDGRLVLYVAASLTPWRAMVLGMRMALGRWRDAADLERFEADAFTIRSRRKTVRVMNDGEILLLAPPLAYRIRRGALKVIVPPRVGASVLEPGTSALPRETVVPDTTDTASGAGLAA